MAQAISGPSRIEPEGGVMRAYWFGPADMKLRHDDGRTYALGVTHKIGCPIVPCKHGLHGSRRVIDALSYARGPIACLVELGGVVIPHENDKHAASERTYIKVADATEVLRRFMRLCALDEVHLWDAPDVVIQYLKTGDESLRAAAWDAAWAAAWDDARDDARAAARDAAQAVARDAEWAAAQAVAQAAALAAAHDAAQAAALAAARAKQNRRLTQMLHKLWRTQ